MVSELRANDAVSFICARDFMYDGVDYEKGADFPQEAARDLETLVRARYIIPVIDDWADKPRTTWYNEVQLRETAMERLFSTEPQLVWPDEPAAEEQGTEDTAGSDEGASEFDPTDHTVAEVLAYLAAHPEDRDRVLEIERNNRERKGILEA